LGRLGCGANLIAQGEEVPTAQESPIVNASADESYAAQREEKEEEQAIKEELGNQLTKEAKRIQDRMDADYKLAWERDVEDNDAREEESTEPINFPHGHLM
jgi:hypothetical protein